MAFPTVSASATSSEVSYTTSHTVTLPASNSGDILVFFMNCENSAGSGLTLTGWTEVQGEYGAAGISDNYVWAKVSSGSEPATVAVTSAGSCSSATVCLTIIDSEGTLNALEFATPASGNSTGPDSATLTPSWGSADTMWVSVANLRRGRTVTTYPYADNNLYISTGTSNGDPTVALCSDEIASVTVDPSAYLISASTNWYAMTMAVEPAGASAPVLSLPTEATITAATATVGTTSDNATGNLYYYISTSATPPSATDLKAGTSSVTFGTTASVTAGINTFAATGLAASTTYYTYFIQNDGASDSNILESGSWVTIAPVVSLPTETGISGTTATVGATSNSATGTLYYYISTSATPPSAANLKDGTSSVTFGNDASLSIGITTFAATGLTASTTYYTYFIQNDGTADSNILESGSWATTAALSISSVTDPAITATNLTIVGSGFEATQATGNVTQTIAANSVNLTESAWNDTSITAASADIESTALKYGVQTIEVTADGGGTASDTYTATPLAGNSYVDLTSVASVGQIITAAVLAIGDQLRYENTTTAGGYAVVINPDATFTISGSAPDANYTFEVRAWSTADQTWGTAADQTVKVGATVPILTLPTEASITAAGLTVGATNDDANGTLYYYISTSATPPSAANLKDGTSSVTFGNDASLSEGINTFAATGLSASTTYYTYFIQTNVTGDSNILESGSWVTIAPVLSLPTETLVSDTNLTVSATSDSTTGTMYYYVSTSATPPSAANLKDGTSSVKFGNATGLGIGSTSFAVTGLTASTTYYTYFIQNDGTADSNLLESGSWATTAIPVTFGTSVPSTRSRLNLYRQ